MPAIARLVSHYQEHIDYWHSRCLKAEDELGDMEEKYQELVKGIKPPPSPTPIQMRTSQWVKN